MEAIFSGLLELIIGIIIGGIIGCILMAFSGFFLK